MNREEKKLESYKQRLINIFNEYKEKELILSGNNDIGFTFDVQEPSDLDLIDWLLNEANDRLYLITSQYLAMEVMGYTGRVSIGDAFNIANKDEEAVKAKLNDFMVIFEEAIEESGIEVDRV